MLKAGPCPFRAAQATTWAFGSCKLIAIELICVER